jgi:hypothetical protein
MLNGISNKYAKSRRVFMEANWISRYPTEAFFLFASCHVVHLVSGALFRGTDRYVFDTLIQWLIRPGIRCVDRRRIGKSNPPHLLLRGLPSSSLPTQSHLRSGGSADHHDGSTHKGSLDRFAIAGLPALIVSGLASGNKVSVIGCLP